jgi:hypothetical protein
MDIYFKSFVILGHQPVTTTYNPETKSRTTCQTLNEVIETKTIKPNTKHATLKQRLCASLLCSGYSGSYRPEGIVFETEARPNYAAPFDMMTLTTGKTFTSSDYDSEFIPGSEKFIYNNIEKMLEDYPEASKGLKELNDFRKQNGLEEIDEVSMKYNECCFENNIAIKPVAIIGKSQIYRALARTYGLQRFDTLQQYACKIGLPEKEIGCKAE